MPLCPFQPSLAPSRTPAQLPPPGRLRSVMWNSVQMAHQTPSQYSDPPLNLHSGTSSSRKPSLLAPSTS